MYCSKCGKEIADDAQFCQFCGNQIVKSETVEEKKEIDLSVHKPKQEETNGITGIVIAGIIFVILICLFLSSGGSDDSNNTTTTANTNKSTCPNSADMEDAINKYRSVNIIQKFTPELNSVYIPTYARNNMSIDDLRVLGYVTACYSAYKKGNDLVWVDIYNYNTGKKIAKYSDSWGFKVVE